jgi:hypothetical protein
MKGKYGQAFAGYVDYDQTYDITMCQAPCKATGCWCGSMLCFHIAQVKMRYKALNHLEPGSGWKNYICCQNYFGGMCCFQPGKCCESTCPVPCMCLETCCCPGASVSATSMLVRDRYQLGLDEDDVRLIRCNNCLFCFSAILSCLGMCFDWDGEEACIQTVNCISECVFCCTSACMTAQTNHEIKLREKGASAPSAQLMER